jgi:hypothetical protein
VLTANKARRIAQAKNDADKKTAMPEAKVVFPRILAAIEDSANEGFYRWYNYYNPPVASILSEMLAKRGFKVTRTGNKIDVTWY